MHPRPVLLIDNDAAWCERVCRFLEPHGLEVIALPTTTAALETLRHVPTPTAVLLEPAAMNRTSAEIRHLVGLDGVPMFIVSDAAADAVYAKGQGARGYVRKSVALQHLMFLLDEEGVAIDTRRDATPDRVASPIAS